MKFLSFNNITPSCLSPLFRFTLCPSLLPFSGDPSRVSFLCTCSLCVLYHSDDCLVSRCLPGNGQCSPGENSRMLVDVSTPNGQPVPQGPNSPSGECSQDTHICTPKVLLTHSHTKFTHTPWKAVVVQVKCKMKSFKAFS